MWRILPCVSLPEWFVDEVNVFLGHKDGYYAAQLLWQRGIRDKERLKAFIDPIYYQPSSPFAFGQEMKWAVERIKKAAKLQEKVTIWGDFDADGITATSVLWEGLGNFLIPYLQLNYYIPDRFKESHGLNIAGIDKLRHEGTKLIITCDTGSNNLEEIEYAQSIGIDVIITDHHSLPEDRPPVISMINPRYFSEDHPLYNLSGVAVAYKLVEALFLSDPTLDLKCLENLLDLVGIGLVADLVKLVGDCRYLAQVGVKQLQQQKRSGVRQLLCLCRKTGDRPMDISFGLAPRINAISRISGDASFGVELLTSKQEDLTIALAEKAEVANSRRKAIQNQMREKVKKKLSYLDLSTTAVIVLEDPSWEAGILGLVASQIAQEYNRPTILFQTDLEHNIARGSARSVHNIDLYELILTQSHLLKRFGGHPFAAGLSLSLDYLPLFKEAVNQQARGRMLYFSSAPIVADLVVKVKDLGKDLFNQIKLLEPYGMGHPVPKLMIKKCWFSQVKIEAIRDKSSGMTNYLKTSFYLKDDSSEDGFLGISWEYKKENLPENVLFDVIVELDFYQPQKEKNSDNNYHVRLISFRKHSDKDFNHDEDLILDCREDPTAAPKGDDYILMSKCPSSWNEIFKEFCAAKANNKKLVLAYYPPEELLAETAWKNLIGVAKYLSRTGKTATRELIKEKVGLSEQNLELSLEILDSMGLKLLGFGEGELISFSFAQVYLDADQQARLKTKRQKFVRVFREEQFQKQYFAQVAKEIILQSVISGISAGTIDMNSY